MRKPRKIVADPTAHFRAPEPTPTEQPGVEPTEAPAGANQAVMVRADSIVAGDTIKLGVNDECLIERVTVLSGSQFDVPTIYLEWRNFVGTVVRNYRAASSMVELVKPNPNDALHLIGPGDPMTVDNESGTIASIMETADGDLSIYWMADKPTHPATCTRRTASFTVPGKLYRMR